MKESLLATSAVNDEVAPRYPVSYFAAQKPSTFIVVKAGWVNQEPTDVPFETVWFLFSKTTSIVVASLTPGVWVGVEL